jgi:hypothetical protein
MIHQPGNTSKTKILVPSWSGRYIVDEGYASMIDLELTRRSIACCKGYPNFAQLTVDVQRVWPFTTTDPWPYQQVCIY